MNRQEPCDAVAGRPGYCKAVTAGTCHAALDIFTRAGRGIAAVQCFGRKRSISTGLGTAKVKAPAIMRGKAFWNVAIAS